jgi:hypothetical protein
VHDESSAEEADRLLADVVASDAGYADGDGESAPDGLAAPQVPAGPSAIPPLHLSV